MLKTISIVTTASYPWLTGTAILPLLRSYYLALRGMEVTLYVPWIKPEAQVQIFGKETGLPTPEAQEKCIRDYLPGPCPLLKVQFYPGVYVKPMGSILPLCALSKRIAPCDWLILEEPEHLNWIHVWNRYEKCAPKVTGIMMTNYFFYLSTAFPRLPIIPRLVERYNQQTTQRHCDDIMILTRQMDYLKGASLVYSSGIHPSFFQAPPVPSGSQKAYFIGKLMWDKGFKEMADLLAGSPVRRVDVFGEGVEEQAIAAYGKSKGVEFVFKGPTRNPARDLEPYKVFLNMSRSETSCSTNAEALSMGKFTIVPDIPSSERFLPYKNCLGYSTPREFKTQLDYALVHAPEYDPGVRDFSWEAAVDRLLNYYFTAEAKRNKA